MIEIEGKKYKEVKENEEHTCEGCSFEHKESLCLKYSSGCFLRGTIYKEIRPIIYDPFTTKWLIIEFLKLRLNKNFKFDDIELNLRTWAIQNHNICHLPSSYRRAFDEMTSGEEGSRDIDNFFKFSKKYDKTFAVMKVNKLGSK